MSKEVGRGCNVGFGEQLRRRRKELGLSREELADKLGVNQCTVSDYETGQVELTLPKLVRIADALGVTIYDLIGRDTA